MPILRPAALPSAWGAGGFRGSRVDWSVSVEPRWHPGMSPLDPGFAVCVLWCLSRTCAPFAEDTGPRFCVSVGASSGSGSGRRGPRKTCVDVSCPPKRPRAVNRSRMRLAACSLSGGGVVRAAPETRTATCCGCTVREPPGGRLRSGEAPAPGHRAAGQRGGQAAPPTGRTPAAS